MKHRFIVNILLILFSCNALTQVQDTAAWRIYWSYSKGNHILNSPFSIGVQGIQFFFKQQANYQVQPGFCSTDLTPPADYISIETSDLFYHSFFIYNSST